MPIFISIPSQRGASSLEHTIIVLVFLTLALAAYESAHWLLLRQTLNTALLDTARIAVTQQAHPQIINEVFTQRLQQLSSFNFNALSQNWRIERISTTPSEPVFSDSIRHDYQALQFQQGNHQIFAANTLHLRLHYLHRPATPLIRQLIARSLSWTQSPYQSEYAKGYVPITTEVQLVMQSDHQSQSIRPNPNKPPFADAQSQATTNTNNTNTPTDLDPHHSEPTPLDSWQPPLTKTDTTSPSCEGLLCCDSV